MSAIHLGRLVLERERATGTSSLWVRVDFGFGFGVGSGSMYDKVTSCTNLLAIQKTVIKTHVLTSGKEPR